MLIQNSDFLISIIIPVYNEEKTILQVLKNVSDIKKLNYSYEVIVVDDGSTDNSKKIIEENNTLYDLLLFNKANEGKGAAVKKGIESSKGKYIIFQDADLEYDPNDFIKFFKVIEKFNPDLIIGSRFNYSNYTRSHNILNKIGNIFITFLFNIFYNTTFTDLYSCYICLKKELLDSKTLKTSGFEQQAEILCKVVKKGNKFFEVPINYNGRTRNEGKKIKFYHIFGVIYQIVLGKFN